MKFEEIYHQYKAIVYNLALNYLQNKEDAQEITQDVFVAVHEAFAQFEGRAKVSTWIYRITINKCLDLLKARKRKKRWAFLTSLFGENGILPQYEAPIFDHPGVLLEDKEALEILFSQINNLPDNQKTALILLKIEGKTQAEVADIMQLSTKAVESLMQRAKKNLEKSLGEAKDL